MKRGVMIGVMAVLAAASAAAAEDVPQISLTIPNGLSQDDRDYVQAAFQLLARTCPDVARQWNQMEGQEVEILSPDVAANFGLAKSHGWSDMVRFTATVKRNATLPKPLRDAAGHTLAWDFGGGRGKLGFHVIKDQAAWFCGRKYGGTVIDVPQ